MSFCPCTAWEEFLNVLNAGCFCWRDTCFQLFVPCFFFGTPTFWHADTYHACRKTSSVGVAYTALWSGMPVLTKLRVWQHSLMLSALLFHFLWHHIIRQAVRIIVIQHDDCPCLNSLVCILYDSLQSCVNSYPSALEGALGKVPSIYMQQNSDFYFQSSVQNISAVTLVSCDFATFNRVLFLLMYREWSTMCWRKWILLLVLKHMIIFSLFMLSRCLTALPWSWMDTQNAACNQHLCKHSHSLAFISFYDWSSFHAYFSLWQPSSLQRDS